MISLNRLASWHGSNPLSDEPVIAVEMVIAQHSLTSLLQGKSALQALSANWYQEPQGPPTGSSNQVLGAFLADWALQALTYVRGYLLSAGCRRSPSPEKVQIWVGFHSVSLSFAALQLGALTIFLTPLRGECKSTGGLGKAVVHACLWKRAPVMMALLPRV